MLCFPGSDPSVGIEGEGGPGGDGDRDEVGEVTVLPYFVGLSGLTHIVGGSEVEYRCEVPGRGVDSLRASA